MNARGATPLWVGPSLNALTNKAAASWIYTRLWHGVQARGTKLYDTDGKKMSSQEMDQVSINRQSEHVKESGSQYSYCVTALLHAR